MCTLGALSSSYICTDVQQHDHGDRRRDEESRGSKALLEAFITTTTRSRSRHEHLKQYLAPGAVQYQVLNTTYGVGDATEEAGVPSTAVRD